MSYLNPPYLTFSGQFQADPSTVNNDPTHFDNANFKPSYQNYQTKDDLNGWWNPDGTGNFRLIGCTVTSVTYQDGTTTSDPKDDPIIGMSITDTDGRVAGKIVDLDSQQQSVSEIWGMEVRIVDGDTELMKGNYKEAPFTNLWFTRSTDKQADGAAAASYQSVIQDIHWNIEQTDSKYLQELKGASQEQLSIHFTVDRYMDDHTTSNFTIGRLVGSIGPSSSLEPNHCVLGRQLMPLDTTTNNYATAVVNEELKNIVMDFSNSFQCGIVDSALGVAQPGDSVVAVKDSTIGVVETRNLALAVNHGVPGNPVYNFLGALNIQEPGWYMEQSGLCTFSLTDEQLELVKDNPLEIVDVQSSQSNVFSLNQTVTPVFKESKKYVIADKFVFRLNPEETCKVHFYTTEFGKPLPNADILIQISPGIFAAPNQPVTSAPASAVKFAPCVTSNEHGMATLDITAGDPGNPRLYIDGQIYPLAYNLSGTSFAEGNQSNFLSLLIFDSVDQDTIDNPTWEDLQPTMQQYANLYPLMSKGIFNLADRNVVDTHAKILKFVFGKEKTDPNYMPVTRDLSKGKQQMILNYLDNVLKANS
jgi:hypothetical protein